MSDAADAEVLTLASRYVKATQRCREIADEASEAKEVRTTCGEELLEVMRDDDLTAVRLPSGFTVKRFTANVKESVTDGFVRTQLGTYFSGKHDVPSEPADARAQQATEFIYERRSVDEVERLGVRKPPVKRPKEAKAAKKQKKQVAAESSESE